MKQRIVLASCGIAVGLWVLPHVSYIISENTSDQARLSLCQFMQIGEQLNSYYLRESTYPNDQEWSASIDLDLISKTCNGNLFLNTTGLSGELDVNFEYKQINIKSAVLSRVLTNEESGFQSIPQAFVFESGSLKTIYD